MSRLKSHIWVSAFLARVHAKGDFALVERKGDEGAGAIAIKIERQDRLASLYLPRFNEENERCFACVLEWVELPAINEKLSREIKRDSDLWIIVVESLKGDNHLLTTETFN